MSDHQKRLKVIDAFLDFVGCKSYAVFSKRDYGDKVLDQITIKTHETDWAKKAFGSVPHYDYLGQFQFKFNNNEICGIKCELYRSISIDPKEDSLCQAFEKYARPKFEEKKEEK